MFGSITKDNLNVTQKIMSKLIVSIVLLALIVMAVPVDTLQIAKDGLVGYWSFDHIVGKTVKDGLNKHGGTIAKGNIKSANNGKIGKALLFDENLVLWKLTKQTILLPTKISLGVLGLKQKKTWCYKDPQQI